MRYDGSNHYRIGFGGRLPAGIKWLLIANAAVFAIELFDSSGYLIRSLGLVPNSVITGPLIYQVATYMFLHDPHSLLHVAFNMLMLWMFGSEIERLWGTRKFVRFYLSAGILAGIFTVIMTPYSMVPHIGASGAVLAVLVAFAVLWPDRTVLLWFFIPIRVKYLMIFIVGLDLIVVLAGAKDGIAHWTHLGGAAYGLVYMKGKGLGPVIRNRILRVRSRRKDKREERAREEAVNGRVPSSGRLLGIPFR